jgi:hypothetical protein
MAPSRVIALVALVMALPPPVRAQDSRWTGTWHGSLVNVPARANVVPVDVTMEIGPMPSSDRRCAMWKTTYREGGEVKGIKDYQLCRGEGADDFYVDEGGVKLSARWIGDALVSPFKVGNLLLVSTTRLRGDVLEEEILTIDDAPATEGVVPMKARSIQRLTLTRVSK